MTGFGGSSWTWSTSGYPAGSYTIHVWANQTGDPQSSWESYGELTYTLAPLPHCSSATLSPPSASLAINSSVSFAATSTGCSTPSYAFWVEDPSGKWSEQRPFSLDPSWTWSSSGLAPGVYTVHAWANQFGDSTASLETYASSTITLSGCASAAISPPSTALSPGPTIALTASSAGCAAPMYEFWVEYPNGTWYLKQSWGAGTYSFNTAGMALGTYTIHAWANQRGASMAGWESYGSATISLVVCGSARSSPASGTSAVGSSVTFVGSSAGCTSPVYEFWLRYPGGSWYMLRAFGSGNSWVWNTTGYPKGAYVVHIWANEEGSNYGTWQAYGTSNWTLN
jgi:hypothetical protein